MTSQIDLPSSQDLADSLPEQNINEDASSDAIGYARVLGQAADTSGLWFDLEKSMTNHFNPGPTVPVKDKSLMSQYPHGIPQNVQSLIESQKENDDINNRAISSMPSGPLSTPLRYGVSMLGSVLDPVGAAELFGAAELLPERFLSDGALYGSKKLTNIGNSVAKANAIGQTINASMNTGHYFYDQQLGNNPHLSDIYSGAEDVAKFSIFGGVLHGFFDKTPGMTPDSGSSIANTAIKQMASDKSPQVDILTRQAMYEQGQVLRANNYDIDGAHKSSEDLGNKIGEMDREISKGKNIKDYSDVLGVGRLNKLNSNLYDVLNQSDSNLKFNDKTQELPYMQEIGRISSKNPLERTDDESAVLSRFIEDPRYERILKNRSTKVSQKSLNDFNEKSKQNTENLNTLKDDMEKTSDIFNGMKNKEDFKNLQFTLAGIDPRSIDELQRKTSTLKGKRLKDNLEKIDKYNDISNKIEQEYTKRRLKLKRILKDKQDLLMNLNDRQNDLDDNIKVTNKTLDNLEKRGQELNKLFSNKKSNPELFENALKREKLKASRMDHKNLKDVHDSQIANYNADPVTKEELISSKEHVNSPENDHYIDHNDDSDIDRELGLEKTLDDYRREAKEQIKSEDIKKDDIDDIEGDHEAKQKTISNLLDAARRYFKCMSNS